ncbi:MAG TPA: cytochrome C oxidase subunit IV family protein [Chloroflexota bacterium]
MKDESDTALRWGSTRGLVLVWLALLVLLALTVGSSYVPLHGWNATINIAIAAVKAALVAIFFMRLRASGALVRLIAASGVIWALILIGLSLVDELTRPS